MQPLPRLLARASLALGLALLPAGSGEFKVQATRGPATPERIRQQPLNRPDNPVARSAGANDAATQRVSGLYGRLPLSFEKNEGQTDPRVEFLSRGPGSTLFLSASGEAVLALSGAASADRRRPDPRDPASAARPETAPATGAVVRLKFVGASRKAHADGRDKLPGTVNYLRGNDRSQWHTGISTFERVAYENIYPGIDLVYYGNQRQLEYDFIVGPGVDPGVIALETEGADRLEVDERGNLVLHVGNRQVRQQKPVVYQEVQGIRRELDGRYALQGSGRVTFQLGAYDPTLPLVIDPVLVYSTFLGGGLRMTDGANDEGTGVAVDAEGQAYVVGFTSSSEFVPTPGAYDETFNGVIDVFVTKLNAAGTSLLYSTFLGGGSLDFGQGIAVDADGAAYVTGYTYSTNFPTTADAFDRTFHSAPDVFVAKLNKTGATLEYSTFLGGSNADFGKGVAVDRMGQAYVTGYTSSQDFPTTPGAHATTKSSGDLDVFVAKLDVWGAALGYSTFLGGTSNDIGLGVAVDANEQAYVTGSTSSSGFPTTPGAYDTDFNGGDDVFVTKLNDTGALTYSTFLGGASDDIGRGIALSVGGEAYVTGSTSSGGFPTTPGAYDTNYNGNIDVFVTRLNTAGAALVYSTFLGGSDEDCGLSIALDDAGHAYITGYTYSSDFPTVRAYDASFNSSRDAFMTKLETDGATLVSSTFLGDANDDVGQGIAVGKSKEGYAYLTGYTQSPRFPTTAGAYDTNYRGPREAFVTKIGDSTPATVVVTPPAATNTVGQTHCVIATVRDASGTPLTDVTVRFSVTGPNANIDSGSPVTDPNGEASFCYTGTHAGTDTIWAFADTDQDQFHDDDEPGDVAVKTYRSGAPAGLVLLPPAATNIVGQEHCVTATVSDAYGNPVPGVTVNFSMTGANIASRSAKTDANGEAPACYTGAHAGTDTITAFADTDNDGRQSANEPAGAAKKTYLPGAPAALVLTPPTASNTVGAPQCATASVRDSFGNPTPNVTVRFSVAGANTGGGVLITDANGQASFCYIGTHAGIDTISAFADTDNDGVQDVNEPAGAAERTYLPGAPAALILTPAAGTDTVDARHCVTATVSDSFGNPTPGVTVRFTVAGAVNTSGSALTDAKGQATFCYLGPRLPGADAIRAYADTDNDNGQDVGEPGGEATETWVLPPATPGCADVDGHGFITVAGDKAWFGFDFDQHSVATAPQGRLVYRASDRQPFRATEITRVIVTGNSATTYGRGSEDGGPVVPFRVDVTVGVAGGRPDDTFGIVWTGYAAAGSVSGHIDIDSTCRHVDDNNGHHHRNDGGDDDDHGVFAK